MTKVSHAWRVASESSQAAHSTLSPDRIVFPVLLMFLLAQSTIRGFNTFSPEGRLFQSQYAIEAIKASARHTASS
ncbi:hypothetical protein EDB84DRAFT_1517949 [Lactarius hengduanensis]|nr:hypothetical protein EDB84DRAFT_1517949 [Lactarius hengduanensis]